MSISILIIIFTVMISAGIIFVLNMLSGYFGGNGSVLFTTIISIAYFVLGTVFSIWTTKMTCNKSQISIGIWHGLLSGSIVAITMLMITYIKFFKQPFNKLFGGKSIFGLEVEQILCQYFYITLHFLLISFINNYKAVKNVCVSSPDEVKEKIDKLSKKIDEGTK